MTREKVLKYPFMVIVNFLSIFKDRALILLIIMTILTSAPILYYRIHSPVDSDFSSHLLFTRYLIGGEIDQLSVALLVHPGLQVTLAGLYFLSLHKLSLGILLTGVLTGSQVLTAVIIYIWLGTNVRRHWDIGRAFIAGTLTLVAPVMLLVFLDNSYYFGYIGLANYHNPTVIFLRPFALVSFLLGLRAFKEVNNSWRLILASSVLVIISALIKPNYLLCVLPALLVFAAWRKVRRQSIDYRYLVWGFLIPSILVLGVQWSSAYISEPGSIIFSPLGVEGAFSKYLLPKFLLSVLFPLSVLTCNFGKYKDNPDLLLAAIGFTIAAFQAYFLAESGDRFYHGNFRWSAQVMLFLWFVVSARELINNLFDINVCARKKIILSTAYFSHLAAGIIYYAYCFLSFHYS